MSDPQKPPSSPDDPRVTPDALDKLLGAVKSDPGKKNSDPKPQKD